MDKNYEIIPLVMKQVFMKILYLSPRVSVEMLILSLMEILIRCISYALTETNDIHL